MTTISWRLTVLAICLSALAGYVDAIGYLTLGGFFVSFMSGNSTRLAVGLASIVTGGTGAAALIAATLVGSFVAGVVAGSVVGSAAGRHRRSAVLVLVAVILGAATLLGNGNGNGNDLGAAVAMALAMGAENAVFERDGEIHIGLTYMTGTLVKLGHRLATAMLGGPRFAWLPYLLLWAGLVTGAVIGAFAYSTLGSTALLAGAATALLLAVVAAYLMGV